jgi:hypothetical protein
VPVEEPRTAPDEYTVITLCGSMRFGEEFDRLDAELTLAGHVVLTPAAVDPSTVLNAAERARLGRIHLQKVAMADEVLIVNVGDYVGESTRREIEHARSRGIPVNFLEPHADDPHRVGRVGHGRRDGHGRSCEATTRADRGR